MICLYGHGYIGSAIAAELRAQGIFFEWRHHSDTRPAQGLVINAAGYTGIPNVDACETDRAACYAGNVEWVYGVHDIAGRHPVLHIGSGCVYTGAGLWSETDEANFTGSYYSECKVRGQRIMLGWSNSWLLRARMPFGRSAHPKNLLTKLASYPKLIDARNSLSCLEDLARIVAHFVRHRPPFGIYNATNPGFVTTREIVAMLGLRKRWFRSAASFHRTVTASRSFCVLDTSKLEAVYKLRPVQDALAASIAALTMREAA